ncbi:MAG: NUDIX hydrolase [Planctomycetaceae bacterium]|nr:NUDIX hydrolase [Planctomycetaceae bacterium]
MPEPTVTDESVASAGRFVALKHLTWTDAEGRSHQWESAERIGSPGAVLIVARLVPSDRVIVIKQFRPPARRFVLEFPAGLMEPGETAEIAAARELREETGYIASSIRVHPPAYTTPGLSDESVYLVYADIDETAAENLMPKTDFDGTENIETMLLPMKALYCFYTEQSANGVFFDSKLAMYIISHHCTSGE